VEAAALNTEEFVGCTAVEAGTGEVLALAGKAPLLVKLPDRPWGAAATLPQSLVAGVTGMALYRPKC
jgi:hypothetical protein